MDFVTCLDVVLCVPMYVLRILPAPKYEHIFTRIYIYVCAFVYMCSLRGEYPFLHIMVLHTTETSIPIGKHWLM
jgi:hypothetical protein